MPEAHRVHARPEHAHPEHNTGRDLNVRAIRIGAIGIGCGILFALVVSWFLLHQRGPASNAPPRAFRAAPPLLQAAPQLERADYFAEKARLTGSYGWVDRQAGIARIPVDEAMRLMAARAAKGRQPSPSKEAP